MKDITFRLSGACMGHFYKNSSFASNLLLSLLFITTASGCTTIAISATGLTSAIVSTNSDLKFSIQRALSRAKHWATNPNTKMSSNIDLQFALQQFNQNRFGIAEFYLKKILVKHPDNSIAIKRLPWTYFYQKRYDKALRAFKNTRINYKKNPEPLIGMGWCYFGLKNFEKAIEHFDMAEKLGGAPYQIYKGKAFSNLKMGREIMAKEELSKFYSSSKVDNILAIWGKWHEKEDADTIINIFPPSSKVDSLFTLPTEYPRYSSMMLGLDIKNNPSLEKAWNTYRRGSFVRSLKQFEDISSYTKSPDAINGIAWSYLKSKDVKKASKVFNDILQIWPNNIGAIKGVEEIKRIKHKKAFHADYYLSLNKLGIAEIKYEELQDEYPGWSYPYKQLGKLNLARNEYQNAREFFLNALELQPYDTDAKTGIQNVHKKMEPSLFQADQALNEGNYKKAASMYADFIEEHKTDPSFITQALGKLKIDELPWDGYGKTKTTNSFISAFEKILKILRLKDSKIKRSPQTTPPSGSSLAHAYNGLGWSQLYKKKYLQAANKFKIALNDREYFIESSRGLGLALYNLGNYKQSINAFKPVVELYPDQLHLAYKMDMSILMSWNEVAAKKYFTDTLEHYPLRASLYMGLGWLHYQNENPDLGIDFFLKAISLDPNFALTEEFKILLEKERFGWQVYNKFGWAYYEKEDYKNSFKMFQISLKEQPNKSESRKGLGYTLYKTGRLAQASIYLNQVLALNPDPNPVTELVTGNNAIAPYSLTTTARTTLGHIMLNQNNLFEAIALFQQELEFRPKLSTAFDGLGWAYLKLNRLNESLTAFKASLLHQPLNNITYKGLREVKQKIANVNMSFEPNNFSNSIN